MIALQPDREEVWLKGNEQFLNAAVDCLRQKLMRRMLWAKHCWQNDGAIGCRGIAVSEAQAMTSLRTDVMQEEDRFYSEDDKAVAFSREIAHQERRLKEMDARLAQEVGPSGLSRIALLFGLTDFEKWAIILALAPQLDASIGRAYAYLQDDPALHYATPFLAECLFRDGKSLLAISLSFMPGAPLRRYRLLEMNCVQAASRKLWPLKISEKMVDYLLGVNRLDERVAPRVRHAMDGDIFPSQEKLMERYAGLALRKKERLLLNLYGESGNLLGAARFISDRAGLRLFVLEGEGLEAEDAGEICGLLEREAGLSSLAYFIDLTGEAKKRERWLSRMIESSVVPLILASRHPLIDIGSGMSLEVPPSTAKDRVFVWSQALGCELQSQGDIGPLAYQFDLDASEIKKASQSARSKADQLNCGSLEDAWDVCRKLCRQKLDDYSKRIEPVYGWDDLILPTDVMAQLKEISRQAGLRKQVLVDWGFGRKLAKSPGISALFSGPSGTGKSMAAEVLAAELRLDLYRIDLALIVNKYIGETEKNLKRIFEAAESGGAILFFDEADALFGKRTEVKDSHDRYANVEVNYLLQRMEDYRGLAILATNRKTDLDRAFLRRLRFQVDFPFPDASGRLRIWQRSFPEDAPLGEIDWEQLAHLDIAGGSIRNIALNAAFLAAHEMSKIEMRHLVYATRREYAKIDKMAAV